MAVEQRGWWETMGLLGLTAVFVGYLTVWLPGPAVGLSFIGVELGEWIKFLGVRGMRNLFYLPPITLGWLIALQTVGWPPRWQTWAMRGAGLAVSLLSFPAIEAILGEPRSEWLLRLLLIASVGAVALGTHFLPASWKRPILLITAVLGLLGAILPTWAYFQVRPLVENVVGLSIGIGLGVWLNGVGHLAQTAVALQRWQNRD
ncbi:MAG: hypothetical protein AAF614_15520 [Chloroflexota bacterium]